MRIQNSNILTIIRQLGTALEWPEAKKNADKVRNWGIEVGLVVRKMSITKSLTLSASNFSLYGIEPREKNEMCSFGEMR